MLPGLRNAVRKYQLEKMTEFMSGSRLSCQSKEILHKSASRELVQDSGNSVQKCVLFLSWTHGVPETIQKVLKRFPVATGTRKHNRVFTPPI